MQIFLHKLHAQNQNFSNVVLGGPSTPKRFPKRFPMWLRRVRKRTKRVPDLIPSVKRNSPGLSTRFRDRWKLQVQGRSLNATIIHSFLADPCLKT